MMTSMNFAKPEIVVMIIVVVVEGGGYFGPLVGGWRQWENKEEKRKENDFNPEIILLILMEI